MSRTHQVAWAAGFFDGEGYVTINKRFQQNKYIIHCLFVGVNHVAPEPLYLMAKLFGGIVVLDNHSLKQNKDGCSRKPRYRWKITSETAANALKQMMPYFHNKNKAAELGLALQNTVGNGTVSSEILLLREELKQQLEQLNSLD